MQVVILAGGKGTRLGHLASDKPKPLVEIAGAPMVEHQLRVAKRYGHTRILMLTGHLGEQIEAYYGDGHDLGLQIDYMREEIPLGTAGAVKAAAARLDGDFFVFYGDIVFDMDLDRLQAFHERHGAVATLVVHPNDHPYDSDIVEADPNGFARALHRKDRPDKGVHRNLVNAGLYCMSRQILDEIPPGEALDFGLDVIPALIAKGLPVAVYSTPEYIKDVGTLDRLAKVEDHIRSGKVARRNLSQTRSAVFLDRDGVLSVERGEGQRPDELELIDGVAGALKRLNASDYISLVVTNQPGVAKGFITEADVERTHARMDTLLGEQRAYVDDIFYCPHHPEAGFPGERKELKIACDCRKPGIGMIRQAVERYNVDLSTSFMIGDRTVDIEAGRRAGLCNVLVETGYAGADGKHEVTADFRCPDLAAAVELILSHAAMVGQAKALAAEVPPGARIVAVGGLARSGKSVFAGLLAWQLRRLGRPSRIVALDDFRLPAAERAALASVRERYDYAAAAAALDGLDDELLIVEGAVALDMAALRERADLKVGVRLDEGLRRDRFLQTYAARGYDEAAALSLYDGRDVEERAVVSASLAFADRLIEAGAD